MKRAVQYIVEEKFLILEHLGEGRREIGKSNYNGVFMIVGRVTFM